MASLFDEIGPVKINEVITEFYRRAFADPMIGYLFWSIDRDKLISQQILFSYGLLGGMTSYKGRPLGKLHAPLGLRSGHFGRRQVIMAEVLRDLKVSEHLCQAWLEREEKLRPIILGEDINCRS